MTVQLPPLDARIPGWDLDDLVDRDCPICGSAAGAVRYVRPDGLGVRYCEECHVFYVSPSPSEDQLAAFYSTYDSTHRRSVRQSARGVRRSYVGVDPLSDHRVQALSSLVSLEGANVLDIGFGRGKFLYCLRKLGATPYGIDPDEDALRNARALGITCHSELESLDDTLRFDAIILNDLIEHPLEPMRVLEKCAELINNGGILLVWTPSGDTASREEYPTIFRVDLEHMQYLTTHSCLSIARRIHLSIVHLECLGFPSLSKIDKPVSLRGAVAQRVKRVVKSLPGFGIVSNVRTRNYPMFRRLGSYYLFCMFKKTGGFIA